jgi:hypothetical protein
MSDGGKGSAPRPLSVDNETFNRNFEAIFGKKHENSPSAECPVADTREESKEQESAAP